LTVHRREEDDMDGTIRLATRGSTLAVRQAGRVKTRLEDRRHEAELVQIETSGDRITDELIHRLGKTGAFVRSLDEEVLAGNVDAAVHSMKDVPTEQPDELLIAAVPKRASAGDVLVTPDGRSLDELPAGATVGTSSLRRRAQLLRKRSDLEIEPLRGNVDSRVKKLLAPALHAEHERRIEATQAAEPGDESPFERDPETWFDELSEIQRQALERDVDVEYDAIVLAAAGLERIGLLDQLHTQRLPVDEFVPSPGQGALAVTALDGDVADTLHQVLDHSRTRVETMVERAILATLGGGCVAPMGVHAIVQGEYVRATVQVFDRDGETAVVASRDLGIESHLEAARAFAEDLAERGAAELIEEASRSAETGDSADGAVDRSDDESPSTSTGTADGGDRT
jgi:hydroxymethylbilane synthase